MLDLLYENCPNVTAGKESVSPLTSWLQYVDLIQASVYACFAINNLDKLFFPFHLFFPFSVDVVSLGFIFECQSNSLYVY